MLILIRSISCLSCWRIKRREKSPSSFHQARPGSPRRWKRWCNRFMINLGAQGAEKMQNSQRVKTVTPKARPKTLSHLHSLKDLMIQRFCMARRAELPWQMLTTQRGLIIKLLLCLKSSIHRKHLQTVMIVACLYLSFWRCSNMLISRTVNVLLTSLGCQPLRCSFMASPKIGWLLQRSPNLANSGCISSSKRKKRSLLWSTKFEVSKYSTCKQIA